MIVGSDVDVMIWKGAHDNLVTYNSIGVLADGSVPASSALTVWGVLIEAGAHDNRLDRNVIAGVARGVHISANNHYPDATCFIGETCPEDAAFATFGNTLTRNSIVGISGGMGIDAYEPEFGELDDDWVDGPTFAGHPLVQGGIGQPSIWSATSDEVIVATCPSCTVELFVAPTPACISCWEAYGRGARSLATAVADVTGVATFTFRTVATDPYVVLPAEQVAVHSTGLDGSTSEHSLRVTVAAGVVAPPASATTTTSIPAPTSSLVLPTTSSSPTSPAVTRPPDFVVDGGAGAGGVAVRCLVVGGCRR